MTDRVFYLAECEECSWIGDRLVVPFSDEGERDEWAKAHGDANQHKVTKYQEP